MRLLAKLTRKRTRAAGKLSHSQGVHRKIQNLILENLEPPFQQAPIVEKITAHLSEIIRTDQKYRRLLFKKKAA